MSRAPPNVPASARSVMDSCSSVVTGDPELRMAKLLSGSSTGRSSSTIMSNVLLRTLYRRTNSMSLRSRMRFCMKTSRPPRCLFGARPSTVKPRSHGRDFTMEGAICARWAAARRRRSTMHDSRTAR